MEQEDVVAAPRERGRAALLVGMAAGASAATSYVVMWLAAHTLSTADATVFLTILSVLFFSYGLLSGLATEITRSTATAQRDASVGGPSLWRVGSVSAVVCSAALVLFVVAWHGRLLGPGATLSEAWAVALLMGIGVMGYSFHSTAVGALTGRRQWSGCATVIGTEASVRLGLTAIAALAGAGLLGMVVGSTVSALAVGAVFLAAPTIRRAMSAPTDCPGRVLTRRITQSMLAQASAAAVVVGFPMMLAATTEPVDYRNAAPLILAISLTRAPLLIPLNAVQGITISYLVHSGRRFGRALMVVVAVIAAIGVVGSLLAWFIGPWLMTAFFGEEYHVDGWVLGLLTLSATLLAILTVTGATCQATNRHVAFLGGWVVATLSTLLLLMLPGGLEQRSVTALLAGPAAGLVVHVVALVRGRADDRESETGDAHVRPEHVTAPSRPPVSVAMATYNGAAYVGDQVGSILAQLGADDELVIIDDASKDDTVTVLQSFHNDRVRLVESPVNRGYVVTFEAALRACRHDLLLLADQDDVWPDGRVERMVAALADTDVVAGNLVLLGSGKPLGSPFGAEGWVLRGGDSVRHLRNVGGVLAGRRPYFGCAMGVRRVALDTVLPFPPFLTESHDLWLALCGNLRGSITHLDDVVVLRRVHDSNQTPTRPRGVVPALRSRWMLLRSIAVISGRIRRGGRRDGHRVR